jgi:mono/diheme cytochrome c family protein
MKTIIFIAAAALCAIGSVAQAEPATERGAYLVGVAACGDCHTPHGPGGPIAGRTLAGATLPFTPTQTMPWAGVAPPLAGGPAGYSEAALAAFLHEGHRHDGSMPRPPMPSYHMTAADAHAVAAYVFSLKKPD